jgi:hypothetical protein
MRGLHHRRPAGRYRSRALQPWRPGVLASYRRPRLRPRFDWPFGVWSTMEWIAPQSCLSSARSTS